MFGRWSVLVTIALFGPTDTRISSTRCGLGLISSSIGLVSLSPDDVTVGSIEIVNVEMIPATPLP